MLKKKVLQHISESSHNVTKHQIARFLKVRGDGRVNLKKILHELIKEEKISKEKGHRYRLRGQLPHILATRVTKISNDGEIFCVPLEETMNEKVPTILLEPNDRKNNQLSVGSKILTKIKTGKGKTATGRIIKIIDDEESGIGRAAAIISRICRRTASIWGGRYGSAVADVDVAGSVTGRPSP